MHFSICLFLVLWLAAQAIWLSQYQLISSYSVADALWFIGYASFGYFLYSLYYHSFRREFEPFVLILIAIIISIFLVFVLDVIVSTLRLVSTQQVNISVLLVTLVYPILDAIMIFPAVLIFWAVRRIRKRQSALQEEQKTGQIKQEENKSSYTVSSFWILLLTIAMILSTIGDIGFAYSSALGPETVLRDAWIWNIIYNTDHLCLAAALIGYRHFFSFNRIDALQH
jgi:H+/gluconate symporter-like permease